MFYIRTGRITHEVAEHRLADIHALMRDEIRCLVERQHDVASALQDG